MKDGLSSGDTAAKLLKNGKLLSNNDILSTFRPINQIRDAMNRLQSKRHLEQISIELLRKQADLDNIHQRITVSQADIGNRCQRITGLKSQIESAGEIQDLIKRRATLTELERRLSSERETLEQVTHQNQTDREEFDHLESELSRLHVSRARIIGNHTDTFLTEQTYANSRADTIQAILQKQHRRRKKQARRKAKQAEAEAEAGRYAEAQALWQEDLAKEQHNKALGWLNHNQSVIDQARALITEEQKRREIKAAENVLQLKESIEASIEECRRRPRQISHPREQRQLDVQHRESDIKVREMDIVSRLQREFKEDVRAENKRHAKAMVQTAKRELKLKQQLVLQGQPGVASSNDLPPSQIAVVKTRSFGTGRAPDPVVEMVHRKNLDIVVEPDQRSRVMLPKASVQHVNLVEEAVQRRQAELVERMNKIICGSQYSGPYFASDRIPVKFIDYVSGETASVVRFTLKNVAYCENSFRFVGVQDSTYREFFDIQYERRGRMAPGLGVTVTVLFYGDIVQDLNTNLEFISEVGGAFQVPIQVSVPKSDVSSSLNSLDFGRVIIGQEKQLSIKLMNDGALTASLSASFEDKDQIVFEMTGSASKIPGHSSVMLGFTYRPDVITQHCSKVVLSLSNNTNQWASPHVLIIILSGCCDNVPVFADREYIDFGCCFIHDLYRDTLILSNRSHGLIQYTVSAPNEGILTIYPRQGFISDLSSATLHFELHPSNHCLKNGQISDSGIFKIPIEIIAAGQDVIKITVNGVLTTPEIVLEQDSIDFGKCYVGQGAFQNLVVKNDSIIMQRYGVICDDVHVSACPEVFHLLPAEMAKICLTYQPSSHKRALKSTVTVKSNLGRSRSVRCKGKALKNALRLSQAVVSMKPVGPGIAVFDHVSIYNSSQQDRMVEFAVPDQDSIPIKISPNILKIGPEQTVQVDIAFQAPINIDRSEFEQKDLVTVLFDTSRNTLFATYIIPVFTRTVLASEPSQYQTLYLQVCTAVPQSQITVDDSKNEIEFGEVPLGQTRSLDISISNSSNNACPLQLSPSLISSPFLLTSDSPLPENLKSKQQVILTIVFHPKEGVDYHDTVCISDQIDLKLHGVGLVQNIVQPIIESV